jgi:hypothetical protein
MLAMRKENVLHTTTVGGVLVTCTGPGCAGAGVGELGLEGSINEFYIGGQEFCVDDVCPILPDSSCAASAEASTYGVGPVYGSSDLARHLAFLFFPVGAVGGLEIWRRKK